MLQMTARRHFALQVNDGGDQVMFGITLPNGTVVESVQAEVSYACGTLAGVSNLLQLTEAGYVSVEGYVLPLLDPDEATNYDDLWDAQVPKDTDVEAIDLDTAGLDTSSFFEPGEASFANLFDVGLQPVKVFKHQQLLTLDRDAVWKGQKINPASDDPVWCPGGSVSIALPRPVRVTQPSALVYAFGVPFMDDTSTTAQRALSENQLPQVQYMENTLERALLHQMGIIEAGAETPWEEASQLLRAHLNPDVYEEVAGAYFTAGEYAVFGQATIVHSVPGQMKIRNVSTGR